MSAATERAEAAIKDLHNSVEQSSRICSFARRETDSTDGMRPVDVSRALALRDKLDKRKAMERLSLIALITPTLVAIVAHLAAIWGFLPFGIAALIIVAMLTTGTLLFVRLTAS